MYILAVLVGVMEVIRAEQAPYFYPDLLSLFRTSHHGACMDTWPYYNGCRSLLLRNGTQQQVCDCAEAANRGWCYNDYYTLSNCRNTCRQCDQRGNLTTFDALKRTIIMIHKHTIPGQQMFIRGGITIMQREGCDRPAATDPCAIHIIVNPLDQAKFKAYEAWRNGDTRLDWHGGELGQGLYEGKRAPGTPMAWTTNNPFEKGYHILNTFGSHYWLVDMNMDCSQTSNGWFNVRALITPGQNAEHRIYQNKNCHGNVLDSSPFTSFHHIAKCGYFNLFKYNDGNCLINLL